MAKSYMFHFPMMSFTFLRLLNNWNMNGCVKASAQIVMMDFIYHPFLYG